MLWKFVREIYNGEYSSILIYLKKMVFIHITTLMSGLSMDQETDVLTYRLTNKFSLFIIQKAPIGKESGTICVH